MPMLEGNLFSGIVNFTVPIILTSLLQLLFNAADLVVVGQFCGSMSVAAVGATGALTNLMVNFFIGLSIGTGVAVAHGIGSREDREVHCIVHTALPLSLVSGLVLTVLGVAFSRTFLHWMGTPDTVLALSAVYMEIYFGGVTFTMIYNFSAAILRAAGDTKSPLLFLFIAGVVNVVTGSGPEVGNNLVESDLVDMVSMTGGTATGREIITHSAKLVKDIALELGGKSPNIFFEDVDIEQAARFAVYGFTNHAGQICVSGTRVLVQRSIYQRFLEAMVAAAGRLVPGDGFDPNANLNTLISKAHAATVWDYIESGKREGARLLCGGVPYTEGPLAQGNFVPVTIFADVTPNMTIFQEEIFGPVGCVTPFDTEEEAIALANGTTYGLAGGVFTKDIKRAIRVADKVKSGQIYVNNYFSKGMIESPGTGWKESGLGIAGIHKYMISKTVFLETIDDVLPPV